MEKRDGNANHITREFLDSLLIETRHLDSAVPSTEFQLFGETFATPVMTGALSHLNRHLYDGAMRDLAQGAKDAGAVMWMGMSEDEEVDECVSTGARVIEVIKPYADRDLLCKKIERAKEAGLFAVGIDIDHSYGPGGKPDIVEGFEMKALETTELREIFRFTDLPIILKGVLSAQDARKSVKAGANGIMLSHHNARFDYAVPPLMIIGDIQKAVGEEVHIFAEDEISTGMDVLKAIALGAEGVCVGRPLIAALNQGKAEGVRKYLGKLTEELGTWMACVGCQNLRNIEKDIIHRRSF